MRKIITAVVLALVATTSFAQHGHGVRDIRNGSYHGGYHQNYSNGNWVAPLIIGGVLGAVIANQQNQPVVVQQVPVYTQPMPVYTPAPVYQQAPIYKNVEVFIPECNCYRVVTVQIN